MWGGSGTCDEAARSGGHDMATHIHSHSTWRFVWLILLALLTTLLLTAVAALDDGGSSGMQPPSPIIW
jgi:hypothetical protein